jgi:hypothetical protein
VSLTELKENILALSPQERHEFFVWVNHLEMDYGDIPGESLDRRAAEIWHQDEHHAPPTHPAR